MPYSFSQNYSEALEKLVKDSKSQGERKMFRQVNLQLEDSQSLWLSIVEQVREKETEKLERMGVESDMIFQDVDEAYRNLKLSLF
jgi:arginyl-tRNA synthetase